MEEVANIEFRWEENPSGPYNEYHELHIHHVPNDELKEWLVAYGVRSWSIGKLQGHTVLYAPMTKEQRILFILRFTVINKDKA